MLGLGRTVRLFGLFVAGVVVVHDRNPGVLFVDVADGLLMAHLGLELPSFAAEDTLDLTAGLHHAERRTTVP